MDGLSREEREELRRLEFLARFGEPNAYIRERIAELTQAAVETTVRV